MTADRTELLSLLRCVECPSRPPLQRSDRGGVAALRCANGHEYPVTGDVPRLLRGAMRRAMAGGRVMDDAATESKRRTAASFGYEWRHFSALRPEWERNFREYMRPHAPEFFRGKLVLDGGSGMGRHAYYAARNGADVVAVDLGPAADVTRANTAVLGNVLPVEADLYDLPFADRTFDFVYSIGVLHHLPDPEAALRELERVVKPGSEVHIYVYWRHDRGLRRLLMRLVTATRAVTTRLPHGAMRLLAYPIAAAAYALFVIPARVVGSIPGGGGLARSFPLSGYVEYPFGVCVNDQFDRFSAPLERRYSEGEVREWLSHDGLQDIHVFPQYGWVAGGTRPIEGSGREIV